VRIWPKSLAGRLAALLVLTLVVAQVVSFAMFAGERIAAFRAAHREELLVRVVSLVQLIEETPPALHERLIAATDSAVLRVSLDAEPRADAAVDEESPLRSRLAAALARPEADVRLAAIERPWQRHRRMETEDRGDDDDREDAERRRRPRWISVSVKLADGRWLNAAAERPPAPPLGPAFLASFLISAAAIGIVGAAGVRWASRPMRQLAGAADRLGRGDTSVTLPETGPEETRLANAAFNRMRERLDRFVRDRTAMLAAIAHDLRTPITTLRLRAEFVEDEETRAALLSTLAEMQAMTEATLAFARGDAESESSRPADLAALVESVIEDAAESGRDVAFEPSPVLTIVCRPLALKRAVGNLVDNATFHGQRARARVERRGDDALILIDDDGPGIPEADLERVFEPFVRLEASRSRATGGTGLGLSIARSILRSHGGDVRLENRPEGGLRAVATLPLPARAGPMPVG
jgi:signal transduction histidine kinase